MRLGAEANDPSRNVAFHSDRWIAAATAVFVCISDEGRSYVLGFLIGLLTISLSLPALAVDSKHAVTGFHHKSWTAKDGLPGAVLSLAQTTDGFLWIGGSDGLFRFDGRTAHYFTIPS